MAKSYVPDFGFWGTSNTHGSPFGVRIDGTIIDIEPAMYDKTLAIFPKNNARLASSRLLLRIFKFAMFWRILGVPYRAPYREWPTIEMERKSTSRAGKKSGARDAAT
jgi:hypothetical protein